MSSQFAVDLRLARKKAGYIQDDIAHLLATHQTMVSQLEHGKRRPSLIEIIELSLIYGRSFESFFAEVMAESKEHLSVRLSTLPEPGRKAMSTFNRPGSLARLKRRLAEGQEHDNA
ncbi:MAG: helix-turn-helix transcriptional regulator [Roseobacter sp.]